MPAEPMSLNNVRGLIKVLVVGLAVLFLVSFLFSGSAQGESPDNRPSMDTESAASLVVR